MYKPGFRKGRGTRHQIVNIHGIIEKARKFQKNIFYCFIDYMEAFGCVNHNKLWEILKGWCQGPALVDPGKFEGEMASANTMALIKY